jgi:hypothetical protein
VTVLEWLLDSDPSIRWQVMRDLTDEPAEAVAAERSKVATEGWGARLLSLQDADGQWGRDVLPASADGPDGAFPDPSTRRLLRKLQTISLEELAAYLDVDVAKVRAWEDSPLDPEDESASRYRSIVEWMSSSLGTFNPPWTSTTHTLLLLRDLGLDPSSKQARGAVGLVATNSRWHDSERYFDGEVEPCVNGRVVALGAYFSHDVDGLVERLLGERLADGGWNCEAERGSTRSSFNTTICVLEGLLEYERATGASPEVTAARRRAEDYLLERRLFRRLSTGEVVDPAWIRFSFPTRWRYDVLRGLDYLRGAGVEPDERCPEAIDLVEGKRDADGRWPLENTHPGRVHFDMEDGDGAPSRWNTLRALRVLAWYRGSPAR